jgi:hypothetical protein
MGGLTKVSPSMIDGKIATGATVTNGTVTLTFNDGTSINLGAAGGGASGGASITGLRLSATDIGGSGGGSSTYTPSVTLSSAAITTAQTLGVNVTGAPPNSNIGITIKNSSGAVADSSSFTVNSAGTGTGSISASALPAGSYTIIATFDSSKTYSSGNTVTKAFTVTAYSGVTYLPSLGIANADITATSVKVTIYTAPPNSNVTVTASNATTGASVYSGTVAIGSTGLGTLNLTGLTTKTGYVINFDFDGSFVYNPAYGQHLGTFVTTI